MVLKKEVVLEQVWAARFLHEGVNHLKFNWKTCNNTKKHYYEVGPLGVCSIFWKKQVMVVMVVCLQYDKG